MDQVGPLEVPEWTLGVQAGKLEVQVGRVEAAKVLAGTGGRAEQVEAKTREVWTDRAGLRKGDKVLRSLGVN